MTSSTRFWHSLHMQHINPPLFLQDGFLKLPNRIVWYFPDKNSPMWMFCIIWNRHQKWIKLTSDRHHKKVKIKLTDRHYKKWRLNHRRELLYISLNDKRIHMWIMRTFVTQWCRCTLRDCFVLFYYLSNSWRIFHFRHYPSIGHAETVARSHFPLKMTGDIPNKRSRQHPPTSCSSVKQADLLTSLYHMTSAKLTTSYTVYNTYYQTN